MINTTVRCFRRPRDDGKRCGIWLMVGEKRGVFFHGDREEVQGPLLSVSDMEQAIEFCEEITPEEALKELESWSEAQVSAKRMFERHKAE